jgi:predicted ATPase
MEGTRFIRTIRLDGILSYGPGTPEFPLEPLNVLIGPNASGKSNLIEVLSLLAAAPRDLQAPIIGGGGVRDWPWKGGSNIATATVDVTVEFPKGPTALRYGLSFTEVGTRFDLRDEAVENEKPTNPYDERPYFYYRYQEGRPVLNVLTAMDQNRFERNLKREDMKQDQSILSQRRDPESYPELTYLANLFENMSFYREFHVGRHTPPRLPQKPDLRQDRLLEDASNLGLVLNDMQNRPDVKPQILERLKDFYPSIEDVVTTVSGGTVQIFFHERGLRDAVPATRLSDGSLRYLCLLAVLCHPTPPPVVCIEEPEIGLHPDVIPEVAKLLVEASTRSQIFVTTHSDILVDALTEVPEAVVVCEKVDGATQLRRLSAEELKPWLEQYRLGELWTRGEIGGNRW